MTKYKLKRLLVPLLGLVVSVTCIFVVIFATLPYNNPDDAEKQGQRAIDALESMHIKGSYSSDKFDCLEFTSKKNSTLPFDIKGYFVENTVYCFFPQGTDISKLKLSVSSSDGADIFYNGSKISGNTVIDLSSQADITVGDTEYTLVPVVTRLPYISLQTMDNALIYPGGGYVISSGRIFEEDGTEIFSQLIKTRVRGNLTTLVPKLSYKISANNKFSLFGLPSADQWTLLANFYDPSMLRNRMAYKMADMLEMEYVPRQEYVELFLNGEYQGVYALGTQIGLNSGNVNLPAMNNGIDGSFMLELDQRSEGFEANFDSLFNLAVVLKDPSYIDNEQRNHIQQQLTAFETALLSEDFSSDGIRYSRMIDIKSFARCYLVNEIMANPDAAFPLSIFIYKDNDGKLTMGPVWDFDLAAGNNSEAGYTGSDGFHLAESYWFGRMMQDPVFVQAVKDEYTKLSGYMNWLNQYSAEYTDIMMKAANNNFISTYIGINPYSNVPSDDPFAAEVESTVSWMQSRFDWIDENIHRLGNIEE